MVKRVTIKDLALALGISTATVARALGNKPRIDPHTKNRVIKEAQKKGYIANSGARNLRSGQSSIIGYVVPDVENEINASIAKNISEYFSQNQFQMVLSNSDENPELEYTQVKALAEARCAGIVLTSSASPKRLTIELLKEIPTIQILRHNENLKSDFIGIDDRLSAKIATNHLLSLGHMHVGYVGGVMGVNTGLNRLEGFKEAFSEHHIDPNSEMIKTGSVRAAFAKEAIKELFSKKNKPTAIVSAGARVTLGILEGLKDLGLRIPEDISIVGYTDQPWMTGWGNGITTVSAPFAKAGKIAGKLLLERIGQKQSMAKTSIQPERHIFYPDLILRGSTAKICS